MKTRYIQKLGLIFTFLCLPLSSFAQKTHEHSHTFYAGYSNIKLSNLKDKTDASYNYPYNGFTLGWKYNVKPRTDLDIYVHIGAEFGWNFNHDSFDYESYNHTLILTMTKNGETKNYPVPYTEHVYNYKRNMNWCGIKVPLNISYKFQLKDTKFCIDPFVGVHIATIFYAHSTEDYDYRYTAEGSGTSIEGQEKGHVNISKNILSNTNEDYDNTSLKRIYAGWQVGVNVGYEKYSLGFSFENEMLHMSNYFKSRTLSVNFGYTL